jgi:predicted amidohydrolase YtcJ
MSRFRYCPVVLSCVLLLTACEKKIDVEPADIVLINGGIYTVDADRSWAEAVAIRDGEIVAVGRDDEISKFTGDSTEIINLAGGMAMPGFHDAHSHPIEGGYLMRKCDIREVTSSAEAVFEHIRRCVEENDGKWINGFGIDLSLFGPNGPDYAQLNAIASDRYFFIEAEDGHTVLVNDLVLDLAGITDKTPDPLNGIIERRAGTNEPNGTLRESAYDIVDAMRPPRDLSGGMDAMRDAIGAMNAVGITSTIDSWAGEREMIIWKSLDDAGELSLRVVNSIIDEGVFEKHVGEDFDRVLAARKDYSSEYIRNDSIKIMVDGVLEGETAALVEPYLELGHSGILNHSKEDLRTRVARFVAMGLQVHMHTIGDGAARAGLDAIEFANRENAENPNSQDLRHHLSHLELIHENDMHRFAELGVTANFTGGWAYPSTWVMELNLPVVGRDRVRNFYPIQSVVDTGANVVGGGDWIYGPLDPLESIEVAITRQDPDDENGLVGNIGDAIDLQTAIDMYTVNAAWLMHQEDKTGSIEVGKRADIIVLDKNLFEIPASDINQAKVRTTIFDGRIVYRN